VNMKVSDDSKRELYEVLAMYYESIFQTAIDRFKSTGDTRKVIKILEIFEVNVTCILNFLLRGKKRHAIKSNEAEDRFIKQEIFKSGLTEKMEDEARQKLPFAAQDTLTRI